MNMLIKTVLITWLSISAVFIWVGCAFAGLFLSITNAAFMYNVTPFIGLTCSICIIKTMIYVYRSNPMDFFCKK